jgi:hypothetical protein
LEGDFHKTGLLIGHTSVEMNKGYTHMEMEPLRTAISAIPGVTGQKVE